MGVIVTKEDQESKLQQRITADLRSRVQTSANDTPDFAEDNEYTKDLQKTSRFGWVWLVLITLAAISLVFMIFV